jgi:hypothetical protein
LESGGLPLHKNWRDLILITDMSEKLKIVDKFKNENISTEVITHRNNGAKKTLLRIDPLLGKNLETNNDYSRCYATVESIKGSF